MDDGMFRDRLQRIRDRKWRQEGAVPERSAGEAADRRRALRDGQAAALGYFSRVVVPVMQSFCAGAGAAGPEIVLGDVLSCEAELSDRRPHGTARVAVYLGGHGAVGVRVQVDPAVGPAHEQELDAADLTASSDAGHAGAMRRALLEQYARWLADAGREETSSGVAPVAAGALEPARVVG